MHCGKAGDIAAGRTLPGVALVLSPCLLVVTSLAVLVPAGPARAQTAAEVRALLAVRAGGVARLRVPESDADLPQPRLPGGEVDPRYAITAEKVRLGRLLFFDPIRSTNIRPELGGDMRTAATASCGTCHLGEAASKAGQVVAISVGGVGRHTMDHRGRKTIRREVMDGLVDVLPTGFEMLDADGTVLASGSFDAVDSPARAAPSVIGFAFNRRLLWGGEAGEPGAGNPEGYPAQEDLVRKASMAHRMGDPDRSFLQENAVYRELFAQAFPAEYIEYLSSGDLSAFINFDTEVRAIAAFLRTVITRNTPWDRFLAGDDAALTPRQLRGAWLFAAPVEDGGAGCIACHSGPALNKVLGDEDGLLVDENFHNLGTAEHPLMALARETMGSTALADTGRGGVSGDPAMAYRFKTPTLRQVRDAAPYFHGGQAATLREAVEYHLAGIPADPRAAAAGTLSPLFTSPRGPGTRGVGLSPEDIDSLLAFLAEALYDEGFVHQRPGSPTPTFELSAADLTYTEDLEALGAVDGWLPSGLPNGVNDAVSRSQLVFVRGNVNRDGAVDIADAIGLIGYFFGGGPAPDPMVSGDANDDEELDVSDPIFLLGYLFLGGPPPPPPSGEAGQDLTF